MKTDTKESIDRYIKYGYSPGTFLEAVLFNNLTESLDFADEQNSRDLREICKYINEKAPSAAWGDEEKVYRWQKVGGMRGMMEAAV